MTEDSKEEGVAFAVIERFENFRLPRALDIKARVDSGEKLSSSDIEHLERVMRDAQEIGRLVEKRPELETLYGRAMSLYKEITNKALENEQNS